VDAPAVALAFGGNFDTLWSWARLRTANDTAATDAALGAMAQAWSAALSTAAGLAAAPVQLCIAPLDDMATDEAWCVGANEVHIGAALLRRLDEGCLQMAGRLMMNFYNQHLSLGPTLPLPMLVPAERFAQAALQLAPGNMLARAVNPLGELPSDFEALMAALLAQPQGAQLSANQLRAASGRLAKPLMWASDGVDPLPMLDGEPLPHLLFLYGQVLSDAIGLAVAHEIGHLVLQHTAAIASSELASREQEVAADAQAVILLSTVPGFNLRSSALLFSFLAGDESDLVASARLSHPFARDRLGLLAAAVGGITATADGQGGQSMVQELNAALQLVRKAVPVEGPAAVGATAWASADLEHVLHLDLTLPDPTTGLATKADAGEGTIPPTGATLRSPGTSVISLATRPVLWTFQVDFQLYDRVHPGSVFRRGLIVVQSDDPERLDLALPPSWWLDVPASGVAVERVRLSRAAAGAAAPRFEGEGRLSDTAVLQRAGQCAAAVAVRAAYRSIGTESDQLTAALLAQVRTQHADRQPRGALWLAQHAWAQGDPAEVVALLEPLVQGQPFVPTDVRGLLGQALGAAWPAHMPSAMKFWASVPAQAIRMHDRGLDLMMRERVLGEAGATKDMLSERISEQFRRGTFSPVTQAIAQITVAFGQGPARLRQATQALADALKVADAGLVFPRQLLAEGLLALTEEGAASFAYVTSAFEDVLARDASFLPALTELAKFALERDDLAGAAALLARAERIAPAHPFLHYVRNECRRRVQERSQALMAQAGSALDEHDLTRLRQAAEVLLQIDAEAGNGLYLRGGAELSVGNYAEAYEDFAMAIEREPGRFDWQALLGQAAVEAGRLREAFEGLSIVIGAGEKLLKEDDIVGPSTPSLPYASNKGLAFANSARAWALCQLGQPLRATQEAAAAVAAFGGGMVLLNAARVRSLCGDADGASGLAAAALTAEELPLVPPQRQQARLFLRA